MKKRPTEELNLPMTIVGELTDQHYEWLAELLVTLALAEEEEEAANELAAK
jgi:hypothetical protein